MDYNILISVSDEDKAALELYIASRLSFEKQTLEVYIENLVREILRQNVQTARAYTLAEVPYAVIRESYNTLDQATKDEVLKLLQLKETDGRLEKLPPPDPPIIDPVDITPTRLR